jgi:hypothetical protein
MAKTKKSLLETQTTSKKSGNTKVTKKEKDPVELGLGLYKKIKIFNADFQEKKAEEEAKKNGTEPKKVYGYKNETYDAWVRNDANLNDLKAFAELYEKLDNSFYEFRTTHSSMKATELQEQLEATNAKLADYEAKMSEILAELKAIKTADRAARKEEVEESE